MSFNIVAEADRALMSSCSETGRPHGLHRQSEHNRGPARRWDGARRTAMGLPFLRLVLTGLALSAALSAFATEGTAIEALRDDAGETPDASVVEVRFSSTDGGVVFGNLRGTGGHGIVLAHGGRFTKESWEDQATYLANAGYLVLAFDFRGRGRSRGPEAAGPGSEHHDVLGAVRYLRSRQGVETVTVIGASFGGWAAARAVVEADPHEIDRLVLLAHSPIETPESLTGCKLFVVAEDDVRGGGVRRLEGIRDQFARSPPPKELEVFPGSDHAQYLFQTDQAEAVMRRILTFLETPCSEGS